MVRICQRVVVFAPLWLSLLAAGCAKHVQVSRVAADAQTDLSGRWNDTDARLTSEALIEQCFAAEWLPQFTQTASRKPVLRVRSVVNKSDEHIDAQVFIKNIERAMIGSSKVRVLAQEGAETDVMEAEQARALSGKQMAQTPVQVGAELGADFVVAVRIATVVDEIEGQRAKFYKVNFELIDSSSGEKVWLGDNEIKKIIKQRKVRW